jgi:hypothetical protein
MSNMKPRIIAFLFAHSAKVPGDFSAMGKGLRLYELGILTLQIRDINATQ